MKVRNILSKSAVLTAQDNQLCIAGDEVERKVITNVLYQLYKVRNSAVVIDMEAITLTLHEGSSFYYVHKPLSEKLSKLVKIFHQDANAKITSADFEVWMDAGSDGDADNVVRQIEYFMHARANREQLREASEQTGGAIRTEADEASYAQWLRFHGLNVPTNVEQFIQLLTFLQWEFRPSHRIDKYWEQINGHTGNSVALTASQCQEIRALTASFVPGGKNLLETLYENVKPVLYDAVDWENADGVITELVHHDFSYALAKKYVNALGWWGARNGEVFDADDLAQVLFTAIILQLDPQVGAVEQRNVIAGYNIYASNVAVDKPLENIRQGFEQHLVNSKKVSRNLAPLASHLLLSSTAPGLLVKSVPSWLMVGSIAWVTFFQAVSVIELIAAGASRFLHYEDVMQFAELATVSTALDQLQGMAAIEGVIDWGLINEVISYDNLKSSTADAVRTSLAAYQAHIATMVNGAKAFSTPVPSRKKLALAALESAMPGCDFLETPLLRPAPYSAMRVSMLDLHIEGLLSSGEWDWNKTPHILGEYPQLTGLVRNQDVFEAEVRAYHGNIHRAMASNIKLALAGMPRQDRDVFGKSKITFFTVREPVVETIYPEKGNFNLIGVANKGAQQVELQGKKDQARGRFAVIMIASYGNNQTLCYELFSLLGECRRNDALGKLVLETKKMGMPAWLEMKRSPNDAQSPLPETHNVPTDLESYTQGKRPRPNACDKMVIEKLGTLAAPASATEDKHSLYQFFMSPHIENIAKFVVTHRPVGSVSELVEAFTELTDKERIAKTTDEVLQYVVDLIVPFKKCIEDLASGDRNKVVDGVYACSMDAIGIFFAVLSAPAKLLSIAAKSASLAAKLASGIKFGLQLTISTLNPIDGIPTAGFKATKALLKSGRTGCLKLVDSATSQLYRLTGRRQSVDFLQLASLPQVGQGKWRPRGSTVDATNVCALKKNEQWYGISSRGNPWGKQLDGFELKGAFAVPSVRPEAYTSHIIQHGLSKAHEKVQAAISVLGTPAHKPRTDLTIGLFFGTTDRGRDSFSVALAAIRVDLGGTSISNFVLDSAKVDNQIMQVEQSQYNEWKKAGLNDRENVQYLTISNQNLNDRFNAAGFSYGEVADDLIHEMLRAGAGKGERVIAKATLRNKLPVLDVAPLLNLAAGRLPKPDGTGGYYNRDEALVNADSFAIVTALLSQMETNPDKYANNMNIVEAAVKGSAGRTIDGEVLINLNFD
ncbi:hypothetical protein K5E40_03505 [Pseudomonas baetica]|uniref:hypothetical protein n=1 Tax=Pseudomonas baetica TaxID=674054 RepID=UPI001C8B4C13|nr:hypothetical protein [Pseudomonas baetica]MBX9404743.1 hypothetical protein [Pseudomonas baetica]